MLKSFLFIVLGMMLSFNSIAKPIDDPTTWSYEVKSKGNHEYELVFHLTIKDKWHIWSMTPGGDGFLIPPSFTFNKAADVQLVGKTTEHGNKVTSTVEGVEGKVHYYAGKVDYVQVVKVKGSSKVSGTYEYQVCSDNVCLPPKTNSFSFEIKE
ncbi:MAG: hypothetical protein JST82_15345 [Bacteroidetes bacterium]|nr:hypothetical protein [Bacteroidota bacterium]